MEPTHFLAESLTINSKQALGLLPYLILCAGILVSVVVAGFKSSAAMLRLVGAVSVVPFITLLLYSLRSPAVEIFGGSIVIDPMTRLVGAVVGLLAVVVSLFANTYSPDRENSEWLSFLLISVLALSLLPASTDFVTFFVILETASISGYLLAASDRKRILSLEAGLKYLLTGAFASAILLMGFAQVYGSVGSLDYEKIAAFLAQNQTQVPVMLSVATLMIVVSFAFKVGLAPFHMWSPDVYQGGPTALSAFLASATKVSLFSAFAVAFYSTGLINVASVKESIYGIALVSIVVGSLMALVQGQLKRMLAYSGVANAGYAALALIAGSSALAPMFSFLSLYALALIVGFAFAQEATLKEGAQAHADVEISGLDVKSEKISVPSKVMFTVAIFSLAGIPPFPGFLAKYQILSQVWTSGYVWGAALILLGSLLGIGYYLRTLVPLFMKPVDQTDATTSTTFGAPLFVAAISTIILMTILFGFSRVNQWVDYITYFAR